MAAWGALLGFMMLFRPQNMPVVGLIVPFVLLFAAFYSLWSLFGTARAAYFLKDQDWQPHKRLGVTLSITAVLLLVLQSLGQLTMRDIFTVAGILVLGYLYIGRSRFVLPKH
jgi:L-asparagine transporter-like permease